MPPSKRACQRCHYKKIKCDNNRPTCGPCAEVEEPCVPHVRLRRARPGRESAAPQARIAFLEEALSQVLGRDARQIQTGSDTSLLSPNPEWSRPTASSYIDNTRGNLEDGRVFQKDQALAAQGSSSSDEIAIDILPDISLLTLNASGEMRYLGPSSGSLFAKYASNFARILSAKSSIDSGTTGPARAEGEPIHPPKASTFSAGVSSTKIDSFLTPSISKYLLDRFFEWVHNLFPLFADTYRELVLDKLCNSQVRHVFLVGSYHQRMTLTIWNLVLALGAAHVPHCGNEDIGDAELLEYQTVRSAGNISSDLLFMRSLTILDTTLPTLQPSVSMIQILLLLCIYGSYKPSGNRQWQLSGIAIRTAIEIGLHRHRSKWNFSDEELDVRRRVFWTAYVVEMTAAFNLGRPPSISNDHIDAEFPRETAETALALHHIRHRQIQSRLIDKMYCCPHHFTILDFGAKEEIISTMQEQLDKWKSELYQIHSRASSPYPIEYWERLYFATTAAVHRPTPLLPSPDLSSAGLCLRSAGAYIDAHHHILKANKVPQSWMLLQGMFLAGITMIVTARTNYSLFHSGDHPGCSIFEVMEWTRKCSNVLNIMSERWADKSISDLETKFSALASNTMKLLMSPRKSEHHYQQNKSNGQGDVLAQVSFPFLNNQDCLSSRRMDENLGSLGGIGIAVDPLEENRPLAEDATNSWLGELGSPLLDSFSMFDDMYGLWDVSLYHDDFQA